MAKKNIATEEVVTPETTTQEEATTPVIQELPKTESQRVTEEVLNMKYALDKLAGQKSALENDVNSLNDKKTGIEKACQLQEDETKKLRDEAEDLIKKIQEKKDEYASIEMTFQEEITSKQEELTIREEKLNKQEKKLKEREAEILEWSASKDEKEEELKVQMVEIEQKTIQLKDKEEDLKNREQRAVIFDDALTKKEAEILERERLQKKRENDLNVREKKIVADTGKIVEDKRNIENRQQANDRYAEMLKIEKENNDKLLPVLNELQTRMIDHFDRLKIENPQGLYDKILENLYERGILKTLETK